mmetsp:Transcript_27934/g.65997  ORF Transcript_27934/g.65997 Transcript_27934/m.65997 type:complete len:82 (+) Transcript_27934:165-410(+)
MVLQGQDAWRAHPVFRNLARQAFPGVRLGFAAFVAFSVVEAGVKWASPPSAHHGHHVEFAKAGPTDNPAAVSGGAGGGGHH